MAHKKARGKIRFGPGCCVCLQARIRGCSIDLRLLVRKECVYADARVDYSANGTSKSRAVLCDLRPDEILQAELEL